MADDDQQQYGGKGGGDDYTDIERAAFERGWIELGAKTSEDQPYLDVGLSRRWERRDPSGDDNVIEMIRDPLPALLQAPELEGVHEDSRVTTTILHHQRGLRYRIIVTTATVEQTTGDVSLVIDKETHESS